MPRKIKNFIRFGGGQGSSMVNAKKHPKDHESEADKLRTFHMNAYNGGAMDVGFFAPVVLDLEGMTVTAKQRPILLDHLTSQPVGHTTNVDIGAESVEIDGVFSHVNAHSEGIITSSDNGAEWQASVGAAISNVVEIESGEQGRANGRVFDGPVLIARSSQLDETSFVVLGADDDTTTSVAASNTQINEIGVLMKPFEEWLKANGHDITKMSSSEKIMAQKLYDAEKAIEAKANLPEPKAPAADPATPTAVKAQAIDIAGITADIQASLLEANKIAQLCVGDSDLHELAIKNKMSAQSVKDQIELKQLRAERKEAFDGFSIGGGSNGPTTDMNMTIALLRAGKYGGRDSEKRLLEHYTADQIQASDEAHGTNLGLQESMFIAARMHGYTGSYTYRGNDRKIFAQAFQVGDYIRAGTSFGTLSLSGILSNVANKFFRDGFNFTEQVWREISAIGSVTDFKQRTSYTLNADMEFEKVGNGGEIRSGTVSEEEYTNQADTYAKMFGITRKNLINDDLDALSRVPNKLGRGAGIAFNKIFWSEFNADHASFFTSTLGNLSTTTNPLSIAELTVMETLIDEIEDPDGNPMGGMATKLLTSTTNKTLAKKLFNDTTVVATTTIDTPLTDGNPHVGMFTPIMSRYVGQTARGGTAAATYLLRDAADTPFIESVFLNGVEEPTIESADAAFNTLGIDMRGFFDFGVNKQEPRAAVKSPGA